MTVEKLDSEPGPFPGLEIGKEGEISGGFEQVGKLLRDHILDGREAFLHFWLQAAGQGKATSLVGPVELEKWQKYGLAGLVGAMVGVIGIAAGKALYDHDFGPESLVAAADESVRHSFEPSQGSFYSGDYKQPLVEVTVRAVDENNQYVDSQKYEAWLAQLGDSGPKVVVNRALPLFISGEFAIPQEDCVVRWGNRAAVMVAPIFNDIVPTFEWGDNYQRFEAVYYDQESNKAVKRISLMHDLNEEGLKEISVDSETGEVFDGFGFVFPEKNGFSSKEENFITSQLKKSVSFIDDHFGFSTNSNITSIARLPEELKSVKMPDGSVVSSPAWYYPPGGHEIYPEGVIFLDLDEIRSHRAGGAYEVATEVAHAMQIPDLPLEGLVSPDGLPGTTGWEGKDEYLMAEVYVAFELNQPMLDFRYDSMPPYKIFNKYPSFYRVMREKWENEGDSEFVPEFVWVGWAEERWKGFSEWWQDKGRNWN